MNLSTGRRITRKWWTALPMPRDVIDRVNWLGEQSKARQDLIFQFSNGENVDDDDDDDSSFDSDDASDDEDESMEDVSLTADDSTRSSRRSASMRSCDTGCDPRIPTIPHMALSPFHP